VREVVAVLARIVPPDQGAVVRAVDQQLAAREQVRPERTAVVEVEDGRARPPAERPRLLVDPSDSLPPRDLTRSQEAVVSRIVVSGR